MWLYFLQLFLKPNQQIWICFKKHIRARLVCLVLHMTHAIVTATVRASLVRLIRAGLEFSQVNLRYVRARKYI